MSPNSLLRCYMVHICLGYPVPALIDRTTADTSAILVYGGKIVGEASISKIQCSRGDNGVAETLIEISVQFSSEDQMTYSCSSRPHAVEHVRTKGYRHNNILGVSLEVK